MSSTSAASCRYQGVVFKEGPPTPDFSCSETVILPGEHTEPEAWRAVREALHDRRYIGGEVRPVAFCGN